MATPPIGISNLITAEQFNELLSMYNSYWSDDNPSYTLANLNPLSKNAIRTGWGQDTVEPQALSDADIILAKHANQLIAQINAGLAHMSEDGASNPLPKFKDPRKFSNEYDAENYQIIFAQALNLVKQKIESIEATKNDLNPAYAVLDADIVVIDSIDFDFAEIAQAGVIAKFTDYAEARYFFNGGGEIIFNLGESIGESGRGIVWEDILQGIGTIKFGANSVQTTDGYLNPIISLGFYDCEQGVKTKVFDVLTGSGGGDYVDEYSLGGEYDNASIKLWATVTELPDSSIAIQLEVELRDPDDNVNAHIDLILEVGTITPITAPTEDQIVAGNTSTTYQDLPQQMGPPNMPTVTGPYDDLYAEPGYVEPGYVYGRDSDGVFLTKPEYYQYIERIGPSLVEYYDWYGITNTTPYTLEGYVELGYIADP